MAAETVSKRDLKGFDKESAELILWAQEQGARIRVSSRGHAIVYGPNGGSAAVSPNSKSVNRAAKNNRAGVRRLFPR